jgi:hypothetical protein
MILQAAEKCKGWNKKRQGMTLVVPQMPDNKYWALAPEGMEIRVRLH